MPTADLEVSLHRWYADTYAVELRFRYSGTDVDIPPVRADKVQIDFESLLENSHDIAAYGRLLAKALFSNDEIKAAFLQVRVIAQQEEVPLRFRLFVAPSAPELSDLRWELLRDPNTDNWLLTNENILFSRYLFTSDWRPVRLRPQSSLRAFVAIANPSNLHEYHPNGQSLTDIDVVSELERATTSLGNIPVNTLPPGERVSLNNLCSYLREEHDILYLICHGALIDREPKLWLEDEEGRATIVDGSELVSRLNDLQQRPKLVVLASCQSAGKGDEVASSSDEGALAALGPRLVMEAGIPAVLAMQGNITVKTTSDFMLVLFRELQRDGLIDRAMAAARGAIRGRDDSWMPVLFMRLKNGRIWYEPGFAGDKRPGFKRWLALLNYIEEGHCTPIIGSGFLESIIGSTREIARRWAEAHQYPMAPQHIEDLPQVAEYLAVTQSEDFARAALRAEVNEEILQRYGAKLPDESKMEPLSTERLIAAAGKWLRDRVETEPHKVLATLPFPIYITTNPDDLLAEALKEAGKKPRIELCRWNDDLTWPPSVYDTEPNYVPSVMEPMVYHLFGSFHVRDSVVLTEDNYFDYLIGTTRKDNPRPPGVLKALADSALLFLGFQLDDWDFRVIFRSIMGQEGRERRKKYVHVAVQINPEEGRILDPERAREYLRERFEGADINIYWGSAADFVKELSAGWTRKASIAVRRAQ
jgi:hypothetical protein